MLRWRALLVTYDVQLAHRARKSMGNADGLSRLPLPTDRDHTEICEHIPSLFKDVLILATEDDDGVVHVKLLDARTVAKLTRKDSLLSRVQHWILQGWSSGPQGDEFSHEVVRLVRGCLLCGSKVIVLKQLQNEILDVLHHAHPGAIRMKALARSYVWWPCIDGQIEQWLPNIPGGSSIGTTHQKPRREWTLRPWSRIHIDFASPFHGKTYLPLVELYSKWLVVEQVPSIQSPDVIHCLAWIFAATQTARCHNNGTAFDSSSFRQFRRANRVRFLRTTAYHPTSNGQEERVVHTTKQALRSTIPDKWRIKPSRFLLNYRLTPHAMTGLSPAETLLQRRLTPLLDRLHPDCLGMEKMHQEEDINMAAEENPKTQQFQMGDRVWARDFHARLSQIDTQSGTRIPADWSNSCPEGISHGGNQLDKAVRAPTDAAEEREEGGTTAAQAIQPGVSMDSSPTGQK
ncbi:LOW QUALITY PROTEIN: hypothetical protein M513_13897 [Trichuris suis]|uniref:RNA-directed DNA polymerase n=1 Tax=Trichuris suis TaxID=68888 RepID=A0A085LJS9_9BILA|nr:LOW QUALITY PROTEIN: hypothetical protein M513_13897 [Trichuris suis]